jgi:U3 small nucleolar RNA-associated protein 13
MQAHNAPTSAMAVDASGALVATASAAHEIRIWDVPGGFCTHSFSGHTGIVLSVLFHSRELLLVSSGDDGTIILWDMVTKKRRAALRGHVSAVTALAWSRDEWNLLSAGRDKVVIVWDIRTQEKVRAVAVFDSVEALTVLPAGMPVPGFDKATDPQMVLFFATGGEAGEVKVWDGRTGRCVHTHERSVGGKLAREVVELLPMPHHKGLVVVTADCHIAQLTASKSRFELEQTLLGNADEVTALRFVGSALAAAAPARTSLDGAATVTPTSLPPRVLLATNSDLIHIVSTADMNCKGTLTGHKDTVLAIAVTFVPAQDCWLAVSGSKDKALRVWHLGHDRCVAVGSGHLGAVTSIAFASKAATFIVSGGADKLLRVWDMAPLWEMLGHRGDGRAPLKLKGLAAVAAHEKDVNCVAVAPNDRLTASGGADRVAKLWHLPSLSAPLTLRGHKRGVMDIQFAPIDQACLDFLCLCRLTIWTRQTRHALVILLLAAFT